MSTQSDENGPQATTQPDSDRRKRRADRQARLDASPQRDRPDRRAERLAKRQAGASGASEGASIVTSADDRADRRAQRLARRGAKLPDSNATEAEKSAPDRRAQRLAKRADSTATTGASEEKDRLNRRAERLAKRDSSTSAGRGTSLWKSSFANLNFFNIAPFRVEVPWVDDASPTVRVIRKAFISQKVVQRDEAASAAQDPRFLTGAVYDGGYLLPEFLELEQRTQSDLGRVSNPKVMDASRISAAEFISGRCLYLGDLNNHFGHFLLGTMARAWAVPNLDPSTRIVLHHRREDLDLPGFAEAAFGALGIDASRIVTAHRDLCVEELLVPAPQFWLSWKGSPGMCIAFDHIREVFTAKNPAAREFPKRLYLSRRKMSEVIQARISGGSVAGQKKRNAFHRRTTLNEDAVEELFAARGFEIVAPETLPFDEQVRLIGNATHVGGLTGSALHMILFNARPDAKLIALHNRGSRNQLIIDALRGVEGNHIYCVGDRDANSSPTVDLDVVRRALDEIV